MTPIFETERLVFHPFTPDDLHLVVDLHSDPEVQRFMGGEWSDAEMQSTLDRFVSQHAEFGMAKWKAFLRDGTFVGRAGVAPFWRLDPEERELGYSFKRQFWGQGLATEAARGLAAWFFATTTADHLVAFTEPDHLASQQVLLKIGMRAEGLRDLGFDRPSAFFRMERPLPFPP